MGTSDSMSPFTSSMARAWSTVSVKAKESSSSRCHGVSGAKACPFMCNRSRYSSTSSWAISCTAARALARVRCHSEPPRRLSVGDSPPL